MLRSMRRILFAAVAVAAPFLGACGGEERATVPITNMRWEDTPGYQAEARARQRDLDICLNPLRRCSDLTPDDWSRLRVEWELTHPA